MTTTQEPQKGTMEEETEALSEKIHHLYCAQYEKDHGEPYWTNGDYSKLDERTKEYDRNIARFIHHQLQKARTEERERIEAVFKEHVPPHALDLEDSVWLKRLLNKVFQHD